MSNWKFNQTPPRPGHTVYFYESADRCDPPPYAHVVKYEGGGMLTLHVWAASNRDPTKRKNVRHISDPKLKINQKAAAREGCWVTEDEHYEWLEETAVAKLHFEGLTPTDIADRLGEAFSPQKVGAVLKRLGLESNKREKEPVGAK